MRIYRSLEEAPPDFGPAALTIGNFDGVHAGHRRILERVRAVAAERGLKPSVLTFDPHPTRVVAPARSPRLMTTPVQRAAMMAGEGVEQVLILPFTPALAQLSPEEFVARILVGRLAARAVLVGENFRFGHRQKGDVRLLGELGRKYGFTTEIIPAIVVRGRMVSSSAIREAIGAGEVSRAGRFLRSPFALEGEVVRGRGVGSKQTVPTLNLAPRSEVLPPHGVYITCTYEIGGARRWPSITNVGRRPTFDGGEVTVETYLLEPLVGETPREIRLEFLRRLREERKFENPEALKVQILRDVGRAQAFFRRWRKKTGATLRDSIR